MIERLHEFQHHPMQLATVGASHSNGWTSDKQLQAVSPFQLARRENREYEAVLKEGKKAANDLTRASGATEVPGLAVKSEFHRCSSSYVTCARMAASRFCVGW
jgi:hypothetical protein